MLLDFALSGRAPDLHPPPQRGLRWGQAPARSGGRGCRAPMALGTCSPAGLCWSLPQLPVPWGGTEPPAACTGPGSRVGSTPGSARKAPANAAPRISLDGCWHLQAARQSVLGRGDGAVGETWPGRVTSGGHRVRREHPPAPRLSDMGLGFSGRTSSSFLLGNHFKRPRVAALRLIFVVI